MKVIARDFLADAIEFGVAIQSINVVKIVGSIVSEDDFDKEVDFSSVWEYVTGRFGDDIPEDFCKFMEEAYGEEASHNWDISLDFANDLRSIIYAGERKNKLWA